MLLVAEMSLPEKLALAGHIQLGFDVGPAKWPHAEYVQLEHFMTSVGRERNWSSHSGVWDQTCDGCRWSAAGRDLARTLLETTRLGIPAVVHEECLYRVHLTYQATVFPTALAWAATFDPGLVHEMASAIGRDMAAVGVHHALRRCWTGRDYRWGRVEEAMGEDPYLVSQLGTAYVRGLEDNGIIATLKHFAGYSASSCPQPRPVSMGLQESSPTTSCRRSSMRCG